MSRFANLEFDGNKPRSTAQGYGEPVRDAYYFRDRAFTLWLAGDFEEALTNYSRSLEQDSTFYEGWFGQVRMMIEFREYPEAVVWADKALEMFPAHHELLAAKAVAVLRNGNLGTAKVLSDVAMEKASPTPYVWTVRAEVLIADESRMAETCIQNALTLAETDLAAVRLEAGRVLARGRLYRAALPLLSGAAAELTDSALAWLELGRCQSALGFAEAKDTLAQCLSLRPNWPEAQQALKAAGKRGLFGWFLLRKGRP